MGLLNYFLRNKKQVIKEFLKRDAVIIDVRTKREWDEAHISNAINIPLKDLPKHVDEIKKLEKPIIAHCKSGVRSAKAVKLLKFYKLDAINGGGISDLQRLL